MKLNTYAKLIAPLFAVAMNEVSAESLRGQQRKLGVGSSAYHNGKGKAAQLWNRGNYNCNFQEITTNFIPDVKNRVYDDCENTYWLSSSSEKDCKKGAIDMATEKANSCTSVVDCADVGQPVADGITNKYCPIDTRYHYSQSKVRPKLIPRQCERVAKTTCANEAFIMIGRRVASGSCGSITNMWDIDFDDIEDDCKYEVGKLVDNVNSSTRHGNM